MEESETPMPKSSKSSRARPSNGSITTTKATKAAKASNAKKTQTAQTATPPEWLDNPEYMVFTRMPTVVSQVPLASLGIRGDDVLGALEFRHDFGRDDNEQGMHGLFGIAREAVKADFERVMTQLQFVLDGMSQVTKNYDLDEITFELGFTAQGKVVFIAEASVAATVTATFKRRQADSGG